MSVEAALARVHDRFGVAAIITDPSGAVVQAQVLFSEMPSSRIQESYGQDDVRMADAQVLRADAPTDPVRETRIEVAEGAQAGLWLVLGIERSDAVCVVARVRRSARASAAVPGARAVRR